MGKRVMLDDTEGEPSEEAQEAARHVLGYYRLPGGQRPGGFTERLIELWEIADPSNKDRLASAFPAITSALDMRADIDRLTRRANGLS